MADPPTPELCILVVDDSKDCADSMALALETLGCIAYVAYSGTEAIKVAERVMPDMVILDLRMPKMDGFEVCRQLRRCPWAAKTVIVAVTGSQEKQDEALSTESFDGVFLKPAAAQELKDFLDALRHLRRGD